MVSRTDRVGSLIVGLNNTGAGAEAELSYAEDDARAFGEYLRTAWPSPQAAQSVGSVVLCGKAVTRAAIQAALADLCGRGPFDLFFLYFAGHAAVDATGQVCFLTTDGAAGDQLSPAQFDDLLRVIPARRLLLFFDSCYAERLLNGMSFFTQLDDALARLYV